MAPEVKSTLKSLLCFLGFVTSSYLVFCAVGDTLLTVKQNDKASIQIIKHDAYTVGYNLHNLTPDWVAWSLDSNRVNKKAVSRDNESFSTDPMANGRKVTTFDYSRSGYDRGHLCPAADNRFDQKAMTESFYLTNIAPQDHDLNAYTWCDLETACRFWAKKTTLYIVAGVITDAKPRRIGDAGVAVPSYFWKVILKQYKGRWEAAGFIFTNMPHTEDFHQGACTVDAIEALTQLDFFSTLPDSVEEEVEASYEPDAWRYPSLQKHN